MLYLYRFFCGILEVEFFGIYPEKIINLCAKNRIAVWNVHYGNNKIRLFITVKDFKRLPKILKRSGLRLHILNKTGFPFFINRYKRRFGIFAGIVIFFAVLQFMSGFIWIIEVEGNKTVTDREILAICKDLGIKTGVKRNSIDTKNTPQDLLLKTDKLSWGSFNIEGCKLTVNVTEIVPKTEDNTVATNLKAAKDGIIEKIDVTSGNPVVKVGDIVKKGDLLVSGITETMRDTKFVHSIGTVTAKTEETITLFEPFIKKTETLTGKTAKRRVLEIFGIKIPLYIGKEKGNFKTETDCKNLKLLSQNIPIKIYTKKFIFIKKENEKRDYDKLCNQLANQLELQSQKENFSVKTKDLTQNENGVTLTAVVTKTEDITYSENLIFTIGK
ncbi:MAG: sporulation protein YqfD [Acutalibacteraceae bacterium]|nr:sporulation protein YqfD [Acutalibacteraceae bacterium]